MRYPLIVFATAAAVAQQPAQDPRWERLRGLAGRWEGASEGKPGTGRGVREYTLDMNGRYLSGSNTVTYAKEKHEDRSIFSYDRGRREIVLRQFHGEGFVNEYRTDASAAGESIHVVRDR